MKMKRRIVLYVSISMLLLVTLLILHVVAAFGESSVPTSKKWPRLLTADNPDAGDDSPSFNPSGTKIAYRRFGIGAGIWIMDSKDGSNKTPLTDVANDAEPDYSPDGSKIAFMRYGLRGDVFDIMVMNSDGTSVTRLTMGDLPGYPFGGYGAPEWSSDGSEILFHYNYPSTGTRDIFIMNATDYTDFTYLGPGGNPRWAFNYTKIVFDMHDESPNGGIWIMNADGTDRTQISNTGPDDSGPDISNREQLTFIRNVNGVNKIFVMDLDGTDLREISDNLPLTSPPFGATGPPTWSPDGKYLAIEWADKGNSDIWLTQHVPRSGPKD